MNLPQVTAHASLLVRSPIKHNVTKHDEYFFLYFQVPKLVEGVDYLFRVAAENQMGVSRYLEADKPTLAKNPYSKKIMQ